MAKFPAQRAILSSLVLLAMASLAVRAGGKERSRDAGTAGSQTAGAPVRLLLVTLDTLRADHLGVYGYAAPTSPALDAFAETATVFGDATCSMPTTLPSHLTLFTGLTPQQHGVTENGMVAAAEITSIFELLAGRGVRTTAVVAAKVLDERYIGGLGIDEVQFGDGDNPTAHQVAGEAVTNAAIAWLTAHGGEPFALWLHYYDPHEPYAPPPTWAERFTHGYDGPLVAPSREWLGSLNDPAFAAGLSERDRRHVIGLYDAEVAYLDDQVGRLFAFLKQRGLWQETVILVVGDHGQAHGEDGFWGHGERLLEPVIQVPLLVKLPGQASGRRVEAPVETLDVVPTLAELFRLEKPPDLTGRSLLSVLRGAEPAPGAMRIVERRTYASAPERRGIALHAGPWKMTVYREADGSRYHLGRRSGAGGLDGEDFYTPGAKELGLLRRIVAARPAPTAAERGRFSEETLRMLKALGYVE